VGAGGADEGRWGPAGASGGWWGAAGGRWGAGGGPWEPVGTGGSSCGGKAPVAKPSTNLHLVSGSRKAQLHFHFPAGFHGAVSN
jgi:hypothetical protein